MKLLVDINQDSVAFKDDPAKTTRDALTVIGNRLPSGSVHGTAMSLDGDVLCSWRVLEYVNDNGELVPNP